MTPASDRDAGSPPRHATREQIEAALEVITGSIDADALLGVSLYGSAVTGGLRPDSDLDLFVVTDRRLRPDEKRRLITGLLPISGRETRPAAWRPLEVTVVVASELRPWRYPPRFDLQYGEWLRDEFVAGEPDPWPAANPDVAVLATMARAGAVTLRGSAPAELLDPVPPDDLIRAMVDEIPSLLDDLETDTRNVLLTLARMWCTAATHGIRSKDDAADWAIDRLEPRHRPLLARARDLYREGGHGSWEAEPVRELAASIIDAVRSLGDPAVRP